jgi:hypothetical protein
MAERFLYRGTTRGWGGTQGLQAARRTPTTTDPLITTLFAIECCRHGSAGVHLVSSTSVSELIVPGNVFEELESEIVLKVTPLEFASRYSEHWVPVERACSILDALGFQLPATISSRERLDMELEEWRRLTDSQVLDFDEHCR